MKQIELMCELTLSEQRKVLGGYYPPTEEEMERLRAILGSIADIFCW